MSTKILVTGYKGRMGQSILNQALRDPQIEVAGRVDQGDSIHDAIKPGMVIIDFSHHTATPEFAALAAKTGCPMVIGTTGLTPSELAAIKKAARSIPVVMTPNMSVGVNLLFALARMVSQVLKDGFDVEIIEKHHRRKKDSPSGTAARLAEIIAEAKGGSVAKLARHGRHGDVGERTADEIGIHAIRGGDIVGDHTVIFAGDGEILEVTHKAGSREIFVRGALLAAKWVATAPPGLFDMSHVLGLATSRPAAAA